MENEEEISEQQSASGSTLSERRYNGRLIAATVTNYQDFIGGLVEESLKRGKYFGKMSSIFRNIDSVMNSVLMVILAFTSGSGILFMIFGTNWANWRIWLPQLILVILVTFSSILQSLQHGFNIGPRGQNFDQISLKYNNFAREQSLVLINMPRLNLDTQRECAIKAESNISEIELITSPV